MKEENGNATPGNAGEAQQMFEILNYARTQGKKIYEDQLKRFGKGAQSSFEKLTAREYLRKIEKGHTFYALTSKGLNLFEDQRKADIIPEDAKERILKRLQNTITELEVKPWELMFHIIRVVGNRQPITTEEIIYNFQDQFPDTKGISRPNVYRNVKRLRMKGYIEYVKRVYRDQSPYQLSEKGKEIFSMTEADATRKLRSAEEWDEALRKIYQRVDAERKQDDEALFYTLDSILPDLDDQQLIWIFYTRGNVYELKGSFDKAEGEYLHMEGICEEVQDSKGRAYALKGLGNVAFKQRRYTAAEQYYKKCQRIAQMLEENLLLSDVLNNLGSCFYTNDDVDEALCIFEKALELAGDDTSRQASTLYNEGLCYARKEEFAKAKELWSKSLTLYQTLQSAVEITKVQHNLREVDKKQKREFLQENYERAQQTGTTADIEKAYKELVRFLMDEFTA